MRVLWFTYTPPLPVTRKLGFPNAISEGWVDSLRLAFQNCLDLKLGIASPSEIDYKSFNENGTDFYNILRPSQKGSLEAIYRRWQHTDEFPNGINRCLDAIEQFKPDIIHIHGSETFFGLITTKTSIPVALSIQGILEVLESFFFSGLTSKDKFNDIFSENFLRGAGAVHKYLTIKKSDSIEKCFI